MKIEKEMENNIEAGVKVLDAHFDSRDWVDKIDPETLEMRDFESCVLGQVFGHYSIAVRELGLDKGTAVIELGFDWQPCNGYEHDWQLLANLWVTKIKELRAERAESLEVVDLRQPSL